MNSTGGPAAGAVGLLGAERPSLGRVALTVGVTGVAVAALTWAMLRFDGMVVFRQERLLPYLLVCVVAAAVGGRVAGYAAMVVSAAAIVLNLMPPVASLSLSNPGDVAEMLVLFATAALVVELMGAQLRSRARALRAEADAQAAEVAVSVAASRALEAEKLRRSERLYRILAENTQDAVFVVRSDLVSWASPSSARVLGWPPDEILGRPWADFIDADDLESLRALRPRLDVGQSMSARARYKRSDQSLHWAKLSLVLLADEAGEPEGVIVSGRNIDAEVAAEETVRELQRQRELLIEQLPVGVFRARLWTDDTISLDFVSARAAELFRYAHEGPIGTAALLRVLAPADICWVREAALAAAATGRPMAWEGALPTPDSTRWLLVQGHIALEGDVLVMDGIVADVTQAKELEATLARESAAVAERASLLDEVNRAKTALLAALGHDLRTPLAVIASAAAALRHESLLNHDQRQELLANIERGSASLDHLLTNLVDRSRLESDLLPVKFGKVDVLEALEEPLRHADGPVDLDLPGDLSCVKADQGLLERALDNILRNALRHREPGTPVTVTADRVGGRVRLRVIDHGEGVREEFFGEMFEPFQRLGDTSMGGLGLGLSIAHAFVDAMGGSLTPSITPGGGLTMTLELEGCDA